jgi:hypothetical protein
MKLKKHSYKISVCSQCDIMWQTNAIVFQKCNLGIPSHPFSPGSYNNNSQIPSPVYLTEVFVFIPIAWGLLVIYLLLSVYIPFTIWHVNLWLVCYVWGLI